MFSLLKIYRRKARILRYLQGFWQVVYAVNKELTIDLSKDF